MSIPTERSRSLIDAYNFLLSLVDPKSTPRVPLPIRMKAVRVLRHFPHEYEIMKIARLAPDVLGDVWSDDEPG